nr:MULTISPECIES: histidine kinase [unclassified Parabacteroides]
MKDRRHIFLFVLIIAILLFGGLYMYRSWDKEYTQASFLMHYLINLPACVIVGVADFLIINSVYKRIRWKDNAVRILTDLLLTALFAVLFALVTNYLISPSRLHDYFVKHALLLVFWNSIIVLLIEIFFYNQWQIEAERRLSDAEKEKIRYQYETLKAQINPHFLFNSLNVLSSLAYQDAEKTNLFAKKMSGVYRYLLLTNDRPLVSLREELAFLESYVFLEQIRFEDALFVEVADSSAHLNRMLIPVSLQLLVENAIKHNVTTAANPLTIRIHITDEGILVSNNLQLRSSVDRGGVGLKNLQKQYALHDKSLEVTRTDTDFIVKLPFIS